MAHRAATRLSLAGIVFALGACSAPEMSHRSQELARETADLARPLAGGSLPDTIVTDVGVLHLEEDYIPGVVDCELGWATSAPAALEAQAIAARTYLAGYLAANGPDARVPIGPHFQCWRATNRKRSIRAAETTRGLVMRHRGALVNGNYASGASALDRDCRPLPPYAFGYALESWDDVRGAWRKGERFDGWAWTEIFPTDNAGRAGADVAATVQGGAAAGTTNRGAFGQYRAKCLAERKKLDREAILRAFYGDDIELGSAAAPAS
jgi:hypothetical protein